MGADNAVIAIDLLLGLLDRATTIGNLLGQAQIEKRDITDAELDHLVVEDAVARKELDEAISAARAEAKASAGAPSTPPAVGPSTSP